MKKIKNGQSNNQSNIKNSSFHTEMNKEEILICDESIKKIENNSNAFPKINLLNSNNSIRDPGSSQIMKPLHPLKNFISAYVLLNVHDRPDILWKMLPNTDEHIKV